MNMLGQIRGDGSDGVKISGDMTFGSVRSLAEKANSILGSGNKIRQIDLQEVKIVDSAGLALLLEWQSAAKKNNITLTITHAPADLLSLARLCEAQDLLQLAARN